MSNEIWKPVPGYEGFYEVSNTGYLKSVGRFIQGIKNKTVRERIMKFGLDKAGYHAVYLTKDSDTKKFFIHRLVYLAFVGPIPDKYQINHIDGDKSNNKLENLNCLSVKEHNREEVSRGRKAKGEKVGISKLGFSDVQKIKTELYENNKTQTELAIEYKVHTSTINAIASEKAWAWVPKINQFNVENINISLNDFKNTINKADCLDFLKQLPNYSVDLIYIDPPYNTGVQRSYNDSFSFYKGFLLSRVEEGIKKLSPKGSLFIHLDYNEVHSVKVELDKILDRKRFKGQIILEENFRSKSINKWGTAYSCILWYVNDVLSYTFNIKEASQKNNLWKINKILSTENQYEGQKSVELLTEIIKVHSSPGDFVLDFFAGSGTTGVACKLLNRNYILVDDSDNAIQIMKNRLI